MKSRWFGLGAGLALLCVGALAVAGSIRVWSNGDILTSTDLNSNFAHIHNLMIGGHGARLVDADVNASAAISHSKMATPALLSKAWGVVDGPCVADPCTITASSGNVSAVNWLGAGSYKFTVAARANNFFGVLLTALDGGAKMFCVQNGKLTGATTVVTFACYSDAGVATNTGFSFMLLDDN